MENIKILTSGYTIQLLAEELYVMWVTQVQTVVSYILHFQ